MNSFVNLTKQSRNFKIFLFSLRLYIEGTHIESSTRKQRGERKLFKRIVSGMMLTLLLGMVFSFVPAYANETKVSVSPAYIIASPRETFTVNITVSDVTNLYAWQVVIEYNNTVLNCTDAWLPEDNVFHGKTIITVGPEIKNFENYAFVTYGAVLLTETVTVLGVGILCSLNFTVLEVGQTTLRIATKGNPAVPPGAYMLPDGSWVPYELHTFLSDSEMSKMPFIEESGDVLSGGAIFTIMTADGGTTDPAPGTHVYSVDTNVSVTAIPELGYDLSHWELDGVNVGSDNPCSVIMNADHTLHVVFMVHEPVTWTVDDDGPADFQTIKEAIDSPNVTYGDVIFVKSGVYYGQVTLKTGLKVVGENRDLTVIDGYGDGTVISLRTNSYIGNLTVRNGDIGIEGAWDIANSTVHSVIVRDNNYGGIYLHEPTCCGNIITNNLILNNSLFGIYLTNTNDNIVISNTVRNNEHGIILYGYSRNTVLKNNNIMDNKYNFGVVLQWETLDAVLYWKEYYVNDIDSSNTVDGKPIYCWFNRSNEQVPLDAGYVWLSNCNNITVRGLNLSNNLQGILLSSTRNALIIDNAITDTVNGVYLVDCENTTLVGNNLTDNHYGIYLGLFSSRSTLRNNSMSKNKLNFGFFAEYRPSLFDFKTNDIDASNIIDGKPIYYWVNQHDRKVPLDAGYVALINSTNILIENLTLSHNVQSIFLLATNNTLIRNCEITNSSYGIVTKTYFDYVDYITKKYYYSSNVKIAECTIRFNGAGITFGSFNSTVSCNTVSDNLLGIHIYDGGYNIIKGNTVTNNTFYVKLHFFKLHFLFRYLRYEYPERPLWYDQYAISAGIITDGNDNIMVGNTFAYNEVGAFGGIITRRGGNTFYHNNFINNTHYQAIPLRVGSFSLDKYDNGYPCGGNYWSNYNSTDLYAGPYQNMTGSDGIGDGHHVILTYPSGIVDDPYPLKSPYTPLIGDVNNDRIVDMNDLGIAGQAFGSAPTDQRWNLFADVDNNNLIDLNDIGLIAKNFGKHS